MAFCDFPEVLTANQIAQELKVNSRTIRRWAHAGKFPQPFRFGERVARWKRADILFWIKSKKKSLKK